MKRTMWHEWTESLRPHAARCLFKHSSHGESEDMGQLGQQESTQSSRTEVVFFFHLYKACWWHTCIFLKMLCNVLILMPFSIFHFSDADYCSFISVFRNNSLKHSWRHLLTRRRPIRKRCVPQYTLSPLLSSSTQCLPSYIYCVKKYHLCSEPLYRYTSVIIPTVPLHCDGNRTLNQCLAPSGFITKWQPIVATVWRQQVATEGGWRKWGRWYGEMTMVPFHSVSSTCGVTKAAVASFWCLLRWMQWMNISLTDSLHIIADWDV